MAKTGGLFLGTEQNLRVNKLKRNMERKKGNGRKKYGAVCGNPPAKPRGT